MDFLARYKRFILSILLILFSCTSLTGCLFTYLVKSSWHQSKILKSRVPLKKALKDENVSEDIKRKLRLAQEARAFAENKLKLKETDNYKTYVQLDRPYVTYIVRAAKEYELKPHLWWFPLVGKLPYKGYFSKEGAEEEAKTFDKTKYDTYIRGVSAYSTLGWFSDPLLSSMMTYSDYGLVDTVIHETVHATIFIKGNADFNERLATFLGRMGAQMFYQEKEGSNSKTLKKIEFARLDDKVFSEFISQEIKDLKEWYKKNKGKITPELKKKRIAQIQKNYTTKAAPKMKSKRYSKFPEYQLNNARLLSYETYVTDLGDFQKLHSKFSGDFKKILDYCKSLEKEKDPVKALKKFVSQP